MAMKLASKSQDSVLFCYTPLALTPEVGRKGPAQAKG